jgi:hypothetical protein
MSISHPQLWAFASAWYRFLDVHAPLVSFKDLITEDAEFVFPEITVKGFSGYQGWYEKVIDIFFDEVHTLKTADIISTSGDECEAHVVVNWHASVWTPPAPVSTRLMMDADQTWTVRSTPQGLKIAKYVVNGMTYEPLSCKL